MTKISTIFLIVAVVTLANCQIKQTETPCYGTDCAFKTGGSVTQQADLSTVVPAIDKQVRRAYWYYLRGANLLFQANIDVPERFISFFIYRNIVGTFLVIGSWNKTIQEAEVNTFVRLGNGYSKDVETAYGPVEIDPFIISLRMSSGEYVLEMDENGNFKVNGKTMNIEEESSIKNVTQDEIDARCR